MKQENRLFGARVPESKSNPLLAALRCGMQLLLATLLVTPVFAGADSPDERPQRPSLQVLRLEGDVLVVAPNGEALPLQPGDAVQWGEKIRLAPGALLSLMSSDGVPIDWEAPEGKRWAEIRIRHPHSTSLWNESRARASALASRVARAIIQLQVGRDPYLTPDYGNAVAGNRLGH